MSKTANELLFEGMKGQAQFAYFQLGVAASAMAFAVHETSGASLADTPRLIGVGVVLWALSFALGCFGLNARLEAIRSNAGFLRITQGLPDTFADPQIKSAVDGAKVLVEKDAKRPVWRFRWQLWTLFAGAVAFIGGHVQQMAQTPPVTHAAAAAASTGR